MKISNIFGLIAVTFALGTTANAATNPITGFSLVASPNGNPITGFNPIANEAVIHLSALTVKTLGLIANVSAGAEVGSVSFDIDNWKHASNAKPYSLCGGSATNIAACAQLSKPKIHTVTATAYSAANEKGTVLGTLTISFTVEDVAVSTNNFFGMLFNNLLANPSRGTPATPWPANAAIGSVRLWDTGTSWYDIEGGGRGTYNWTNFDALVDEAASHQADVLYTFGRTPSWALPTNIPITSITRVNNLVTVKTAAATGLFYVTNFGATTQSVITFSGITDANFKSLNGGSFTIGPNTTSSVLSFTQSGTNADAAYSANGKAIGTFTAGCTGSWAFNGPFGPNEGCAEAPYNINDWDNFVTALVTHAKGRIKQYEMWNEINLQYFWKGDKQTMVTMVQHARSIIKSIDPQALILSPAVTACENNDPRCGRTWISEWLAMGGKALVDAVGFHNYASDALPPEQAVQQVTDEKTVLTENGMTHTPLWDTESSWSTNSGLPGANDQLAFLARHFILQAALGVQRSYWYAYDNTLWGTLFWAADGSNSSGTVGLTRAGKGYPVLTNLLKGATYPAPCASVSGTASTKLPEPWTCKVRLASGVSGEIVWYDTYYSAKSTSGINDTTATVKFEVDSTFKHYKNLGGNTIAISSGTVDISEVPIILVP